MAANGQISQQRQTMGDVFRRGEASVFRLFVAVG